MELVPRRSENVKKTLCKAMSPGALDRFSISTIRVKQLKPNYKFAVPVIALVKQSNIS